MKVFLSSVRRGLEVERDALPGLLRAIGHEPVRFEDFTAQTEPSREACLKGIAESDAYVLLLGPNYGHRFADTGQSPTHDEWAAAVEKGMPRFVFKKSGVDFEPDQQTFAREVSSYQTGSFYEEFSSVDDLQVKVARAVRELAERPSPLRYEALAEPVAVDWRPAGRQAGVFAQASHAGPALELHVVPLGTRPLSSRVMAEVARSLPDRVRASRLVAADKAIHVTSDGGALGAAFDAERRGWQDVQKASPLGISVRSTGQVSVWASLPADGLGAVLDEDALPTQVAGLLRAIGMLRLIDAQKVAICIGLDSGWMVGTGSVADFPRHSGRLGGSSDSPIRVEPDEVVTIAALGPGADEVAEVLSSALIRSLTH